MKKFAFGYAVGVVTAPAVYYVFRKPLIETVGLYFFAIFSDEDTNDSMYSLMSTRNNFQDLRRKYGKPVRQLKAQGHSVSEIANAIGHSEKAVRILLFAERHEGES